jgi:dihydropteroate synthase
MFTLNCKGRLLVIDKPIVMGILNITPDSFYPGSRVNDTSVLTRAEQMLAEGAAILDIGGQSTRPGSEQIGAGEELKRVIGSIESLIKRFPDAIISVDTYHSVVAKEAVQAGASIINDISGGNLDPEMIPAVSGLDVPFICMHMKGTPGNMQEQASYENVTKEVLDYFTGKVDECKKAGIHDVIIDPGFGFAKTIAHNFQLLRDLPVFKMLDKPILAGISRKSTVYKTLKTTPGDALNGTTVLHTIALLNGATILRVHDVKEAVEAIELVQAYRSYR